MPIPDVIKANYDPNLDRPRWASQMTFRWAIFGAVIGFGNLIYFPDLCAKWGGFAFFGIPYVILLFFAGTPLLLMEMGLGQKFQRANFWPLIHPKLAGVGYASAFGALIIALNYNVMIGWVVVHLFYCFHDPLPWLASS